MALRSLTSPRFVEKIQRKFQNQTEQEKKVDGAIYIRMKPFKLDGND